MRTAPPDCFAIARPVYSSTGRATMVGPATTPRLPRRAARKACSEFAAPIVVETGGADPAKAPTTAAHPPSAVTTPSTTNRVSPAGLRRDSANPGERETCHALHDLPPAMLRWVGAVGRRLQLG